MHFAMQVQNSQLSKSSKYRTWEHHYGQQTEGGMRILRPTHIPKW
ncbi:unnamed protein product, partial [Brassica oleracea var. botrytis]